MPVTVTKPCAACGKPIAGAPQKRFCASCRLSRYRTTTRYLRRGERVPDGEPGRYPASHGYIRLRWRIAPYTYVETYEHRVRDGRIVLEDEVHHLNLNRGDNGHENLLPLSTEEHHLRHTEIEWYRTAAELYVSGLSTQQIAKRLSHNASTVWRVLKRMGIPIRSEARVATPDRERKKH